MNESHEPKLAPPGAGLPKIEHFIGRLLFALRRLRGSRESFQADFVRKREAIRKLYLGLDDELASRRVLIKRLRGLEDSSRNWSVWMTLDHLRIVNHAIARTIKSLAAGTVPEGRASTADVKPSPEVNPSVVAKYEASCDMLVSFASAVSDLKTQARYTHPWFGPLDAFSWHAMSGTHMGIHRGQIESIIEGLRSA